MLIENTVLRGAMDEIIEVDVTTLGISVEHLVRPIVESDVYELALKDEQKWEPIEIRWWPEAWAKPSPDVLYHVISGNHRTSAARVKGVKTLRARLIEASDELSYLIAAIRSNTAHGKNFTRDEYILNARKLQEQGLPLGEIASVLGYSKSTVSRWLTGSDSHAASKRASEAVELLVPPENISALGVMPCSEVSAIKQKMMGLLMDAGLGGTVQEGRTYVATLKPTQQEALRALSSWLREVLAYA